jgi:phosphate/sulfate permease
LSLDARLPSRVFARRPCDVIHVRGLFVTVLLCVSLHSLWNLGTWSFGLPASSSHTLVGSIIGVGVTNALLHGRSGTSGVDWTKAKEVARQLLLSPLFGFALAAVLLLILKAVRPEGYGPDHVDPDRHRPNRPMRRIAPCQIASCGSSPRLRTAAATIAAADLYGLPVSTTHVLSSGVAGTMAANGSGLQLSTVRNIALAWVLTLPAAMVISGTLYWVLSALF